MFSSKYFIVLLFKLRLLVHLKFSLYICTVINLFHTNDCHSVIYLIIYLVPPKLYCYQINRFGSKFPFLSMGLSILVSTFTDFISMNLQKFYYLVRKIHHYSFSRSCWLLLVLCISTINVGLACQILLKRSWWHFTQSALNL